MSSDIKTMNAIIESTTLGTADHGCLSVWLTLDYGGACQAFGGWALYLPSSYRHHDRAASYAGHFIFRVLEIAGVDEWSKLKGKTIRVKASHNKVHAIGHIVKEDWFDPTTDFMSMKEKPAHEQA